MYKATQVKKKKTRGKILKFKLEKKRCEWKGNNKNGW